MNTSLNEVRYPENHPSMKEDLVISSRVTKAVASLVTLLALSASLAVPAMAATKTPHLLISPSTKLANNQRVAVSGTGFKSHQTIYIVECLTKAKGEAGCNALGAIPVTTTSTGALPATPFKVHTGKIGNGRCGTTKANAKNCDISVGTVSGTDTATATISFTVK